MQLSWYKFLLAASSGVVLAAAAQPAAADQITGFVFDNITFNQTSNAAPTAPSAYFLSMGATFNTAGDYNTASASYPGAGSPQSLPSIGTTEFNYNSAGFSSVAALHAQYQFGNYTITTSGAAGTATSVVPYAADHFAAAVPYLTNFSSLSSFNTAAAFTIDYNSFTPASGVSEGYTFLTIYNATTGAAVFSDEFQSPSATSALLAAGTLAADTSYEFEIDFSDRLDGFDTTDNEYTEQGFDLRTDGDFTTAASLAAVPEPGTLAIFGTALAGLGLLRRGRSRRSA